MRLFVPLACLALFIVLGVVASSSCVLATRDLPEGGPDSEAASPLPVDASEAEADDVDNDCGCCIHAILPLLPYCSGKVAFAIPALDCSQETCKGKAYALCQEGCYTACGCRLPEGYTLEDAGFFFMKDGGEEGGDETHDAAGPGDGGVSDAEAGIAGG